MKVNSKYKVQVQKKKRKGKKFRCISKRIKQMMPALKKSVVLQVK